MYIPLLTWLFLFTVWATAEAQSKDCDESGYLTSITKLTDGGARDRYFSLSAASPVTNVIRSNKTLEKEIDPLYKLFDEFTAIIENRQKNDDFLACNLPISFQYIRLSKMAVIRRQFGNFTEDLECPSRVDVDIAVERNELDEEARERGYDTLQTGLEALYQAASRITVIPSEKTWERGTFRTFGFQRAEVEQDCTVDSLFAYRKNDKYFIRAAISNWPADVFAKDFDRQQINEYVPRKGQTALLGPHIKVESECEFENSSTQLSKWRGEVPLAHGGNAELENRFGVLGIAQRANSVAVDLAEDSITGSNIAILALPMLMNFVPVAFIADLNTFAMLCYVIFTDVFSTLPFLIKGVELINTGNGARRAMGAYLLGNATLGQMEIFAAVCKGKESYRILGIAFIAIASVLMIFGIWLEVFARRVMQRRRRRGKEGGPFGEMLEMVGYGPMGAASDDEKMRKFAYEVMMEEGIGARDKSTLIGESPENSMPSLPSRISTSLRSWMATDHPESGGANRQKQSSRVIKKDH